MQKEKETKKKRQKKEAKRKKDKKTKRKKGMIVKMKNQEKQKILTKGEARGITLIALVITIIVLLILAGVSITMLTGENGLLTQAGKAKTMTDDAQIRENITMAYNSAMMTKYAEGGQTFIADMTEELEKTYGTGNVTITESGETYTVIINDATYVITSDGDVKQANWYYDEDGNVTNGTVTLGIGDYVNYDPTLENTSDTTYTATATKTGASADQNFSVSDYTGGWRVLGTDGESVLLISEGFVGDLTLSGREGFENGVSELNNLCSIYGNGKYAQSARSVTVDDANKLTGYEPAEPEEVTYVWNGTTETYDETLYYYYDAIWNGEKLESYGGNYTSDGFYWYDNGWKHVENNLEGTIATIKNTWYSYWIYEGTQTSLGNGYYSYDTATPEQELLLTGNWFTSYWLASSYAYAGSDCANFGLFCVRGGGFLDYCYLAFSNGVVYGSTHSSRAVVSLKSNIKFQENGTNNWMISEGG